MGKEHITGSTIQIVRERLLAKAREYARTMSEEEALQSAITDIYNEMEELGPDTENLQATLDDIKHAQEEAGAPLGKLANDGNSLEMQYELTVVRMCRRAMLKAMSGSVRRSFIFSNTAKSYFEPGELTGEISDRGWLYELMQQTGEKDEEIDRNVTRCRNEIIVLTAAMSEGVCTPAVFLKKYRQWFSDDRKYSDELLANAIGKPGNNADKDYEKIGYEKLAGELLLTATTRERDSFFDALGVKNSGKPDNKICMSFLRGELQGDAQQINEILMPIVKRMALHKLDSCLNTALLLAENRVKRPQITRQLIVEGNTLREEFDDGYADMIGRDGGLILTQNYDECMRDLESMGYVYNKKEFSKTYLQREYRKARVALAETTAVQCANPYIALISNEELEKANIENFAPGIGGDKDRTYLDAYAKDRLRIEECGRAMDATEAARNFIVQDETIALPCSEDEDLVMYRKEGHSLIFRTEHVLMPDGEVLTHFVDICLDPGLFFNPDMAADIDGLINRCNELPHDSVLDIVPKGAKEMIAAMQALHGAAISKNPTDDELDALKNKLNELKAAAEYFFEEHKSARTAERLPQEDKDLAIKWTDIALDAVTFAEKKTYLLGGISEHMKELIKMELIDAPEGMLDEQPVINGGKKVGLNFDDYEDDIIVEENPQNKMQGIADRVNALNAGAIQEKAKSESALINGKKDEAIAYGTNALVQQSVAALLRSTLGAAGNEAELEKMVRASDIFKTELKKVDFCKMGSLAEALKSNFGTHISCTVLDLAKGKGGVGQADNQPKLDNPVKGNEQSKPGNLEMQAKK